MLLNLYTNKNLEWPDFDKYSYKSLITESSFISEDIIISDNTKVTLLSLASNGIFIFFLSKSDDLTLIKKDLLDFSQKYLLPPTGVFCFVRTPTQDLFLDDNHKLISIEYMQDRFENLYENTLRPQVDLNYIKFPSTVDMLFAPDTPSEYKDDNGEFLIIENTGDPSFIAPLVSSSIIRRTYSKLEDTLKTSYENGIMTDSNGQRYKRYSTRTKLFGYSYRDDWYPIAEDNSDKFFLFTILGGIVGLHKYRTGEFMQGFLYTLTFGGFGIFYIFDVLAMFSGSYFVTTTDYSEDDRGKLHQIKSKVFLDKLSSPLIGMAGLLISIIIAYISIRFGYMRLLRAINEGISALASNYATQSLEILQ